MGKRSNFERRESDFYPTPRAAVVPLLSHLRGIRTFAEPCCGDGALVHHLESYGLRCVYAGDIATGQDALVSDGYGEPDCIISNPPYVRPLMHALISHFQCIAPTWLLLEMDWSSTKQAAPFLRACSDIVAIGRVKWIPESKFTGKDNFAWFRFDARHPSGPVFHWRDRPDVMRPRAGTCVQCGATHQPRRSDSRFCSNACRQSAYRERVKRNTTVTPAVGLDIDA
jgi:hypothetical protein